MTTYKWNLLNLKKDFYKIIDTDNNKLIIDDLNKILYMLKYPNNFDNSDVLLFKCEVESVLATIDPINDKEIKNDKQFKILKMINEDSKEILKSFSIHNLRKKRNKSNKRGLFEGILWVDYTLISLNKDYYSLFQELKSNNCMSINKNSDTWFIRLKSINKNYYNISYVDSLNDMSNLFYSFSYHQLDKEGNNRNDSIYDLTLEIYYFLIASDILKNKYYQDSYKIKYNVFNSLKAGLNEFEFITYHNDDLEYNKQTSNYRITKKSSMFDEELAQNFYKSIDYDSLSLSIKNTYSHLLAIYLYNQYQIDKEKSLANINKLIKIIGRVNDNEILKYLDIDINDFVNCNYFDNFYKTCKKEYKKKKRKL